MTDQIVPNSVEEAVEKFNKEWAEHEALLKEYNAKLSECHRLEDWSESEMKSAAGWDKQATYDYNTPEEKHEYRRLAKFCRARASVYTKKAEALRAEAAPIWEAVKAISRNW